MASAKEIRLARYREIGDDYQSGMKVDEICRKYSCHATDIYRAIDRLGLPRRQDEKEVAPALRKQEAS